MTIYEVMVYLYEGEDISLGLFRERLDAEAELRDAFEDWMGPNVQDIEVVERKVQ